MFEDDRKRFQEWLNERQHHFNEQGLSIHEIAVLAIDTQKFSINVIREWEQNERFQRMPFANG